MRCIYVSAVALLLPTLAAAQAKGTASPEAQEAAARYAAADIRVMTPGVVYNAGLLDLAAAYTKNYFGWGGTTVSAYWESRTIGNASYLFAADMNGDSGTNDLIYVPKDAGDITLEDPTTFARLDTLIRSDPCLQRQRGRLLERNSCHNPWVHDMQLRLARRFALTTGRELEITVDLFNVLNFVNGEWGLPTQVVVGGEGHVVPLLQLTGYDEAHGRGVYRLVPVYRQVDGGARWRFQLGGALLFH